MDSFRMGGGFAPRRIRTRLEEAEGILSLPRGGRDSQEPATEDVGLRTGDEGWCRRMQKRASAHRTERVVVRGTVRGML